MRHVKRRTHNLTYRGDGKEVGDLSCQRVSPGHIRSHWKPSAEELEILNRGGHVELDLLTEPICPVSVNVEPPEPCIRCGGEGSQPAGEDTCTRCAGNGTEPDYFPDEDPPAEKPEPTPEPRRSRKRPIAPPV